RRAGHRPVSPKSFRLSLLVLWARGQRTVVRVGVRSDIGFLWRSSAAGIGYFVGVLLCGRMRIGNLPFEGGRLLSSAETPFHLAPRLGSSFLELCSIMEASHLFKQPG